MKILFEKIQIKNFLSFGNDPTTIVLNNSPLTLVSGPNGTGKTSTFLDAICYALYGSNFRDVKIGNLQNIHNTRPPLITLWFTANGVSYEIQRSPDEGLKLWKEGKPVVLGTSKLDSQALFQSIIQIDKATFKQMVLMGVKFKSFLDMEAKDRRQIVEELLDLTIFTDMNENLKAYITDNTAKINEYSHVMNKLDDRIRLMNEFYNSTKNTADFEKERKEEQIVNWQDEVAIHKAKIATLLDEHDILAESLLDENKTSKADRVEKKLSQMNEISSDFKIAIAIKREETQFLENHETCPTCTQIIEPNFRKEKINNNNLLLDERQGSFDRLKSRISELNQELDGYRVTHAKIASHINSIKKIGIDIKILEQNIKQAQADIAAMKKKKTVTDRSEHDELVKRRQEVHLLLEDEYDTRRSLEFLKVMLKDTGIKTYIISSYLPQLNEYINDYLLNVMKVSIQYVLDENFHGHAALPKRENFEFNSFSEGEKARISLAIMFAWRKIAKKRGAVDCNLLVMDEVFDGSLDDEGVEALCKILKEVNENENYIVISPRRREFKNIETRELIFSKPNVYTEIVEILS